MLLVYSVRDNLMIHNDIQDKKFLHTWHLLLYERGYFLHGQQTLVSILSTIKNVFVCFSSVSCLKWQPHLLQPKGMQRQPIDWSLCPWSLCPLCALWPPYHYADSSHCFLHISEGGLTPPLQWQWCTPSVSLSPPLLSECGIMWPSNGYVHHNTQRPRTSPHLGCCISPL